MNEEQTEKQLQQLNSNNNNTIHWNKRWMVYSKDVVLDKLTENLDTLIKYFSACEEEKHDIIFNNKMESYIQSRLQNIHNLISSLTLHDEIPQDIYSTFDHLQGEIEQEFKKAKENVDLPLRILSLKNYIDCVLDMELFDDDEESIASDEESDEDNLLLEDEILKGEEFISPDNASIISVNNECKKRKTM